MNRRAAVAGGGSLLLVITSLSAGSPALAASSDLSPTGEAAFSHLSSCISSDDTNTVRVQFLVDESLSLRTNDPDDSRVQALNSAVRTLAGLDRQLEKVGKSVEVSGATFAEGYQDRLGWSDVTKDRAAIDGFVQATAGYDQGRGTNYVAALQGTRQAFEDAPTGTCRAVFWFTDGKLDMDFAGAELSNQAAWDALSSRGGMADALRRDGVTMIALPLFSEAAPDNLKAAPLDRAKLQAIAEGTGTSEGATADAGTPWTQLPEGSSPGAYLESGDPSRLAGYFTYAVARSTGYTDAGTVDCPSDACPGGLLPVDVEPGIADTQILFFPKDKPGPLSVRNPAGQTVLESQPGQGSSVAASGAEVSIRWDGDLAVVDISQASDSAAAGQWSIQSDPSHPSAARILLRSGLRVSLPKDRPPLIAGQPTSFDLTVTQADGTPVRPDVYSSFEVAAGIDSTSEAQPEGQGVYRTEVTAGTVSDEAQLRAEVRVVTRNGTTLDDLKPAFDLPVAPPEGFPTAGLAPFPRLEGVIEGSTTLELANPSDEETTVTIQGLSLESPEGSTQEAMTLTGAEVGQPMALAPGETRRIPVSFTPAQSVDGVAHGQITIELDSGQPGQPTLKEDLAFDIQMARPVHEGLRWGLALLFAALSLLIPVLMLYVVGRRQARFRVRGRLSAIAADALLNARTGKITATTGGPFGTDPNSWHRIPVEQPTREFTFGGLRFRGSVSARPSRGAFIPLGEVTADRGIVVAPDSLRFSGLGVSGMTGATSGFALDARDEPTWFLHIPDPEQLRVDASDIGGGQEPTVPVRIVGFSGADIARFDSAVNGWSDGRDLLELLQDRMPQTPHAAPARSSSRQPGSPTADIGFAASDSAGVGRSEPPPADWASPSVPPPATWDAPAQQGVSSPIPRGPRRLGRSQAQPTRPTTPRPDPGPAPAEPGISTGPPPADW